MPANKNALIRYKTIDNCLRNHYHRWTLEDLVNACSDALYEFEGINKGVSLRTVQGDIQMMRLHGLLSLIIGKCSEAVLHIALERIGKCPAGAGHQCIAAQLNQLKMKMQVDA